MNCLRDFRPGGNGGTRAELRSFGFAEGAKPKDDKSRDGVLSTGLGNLL
jgi:hypothetical protein